MTNPSAAPEASPPLHTAAPSVALRDRNIALISALLLLIGMPVGWLPGSTGDVIGMTVAILIDLAVLAGLVVWLVPRERAIGGARASRSALILGIAAVIVGVAFWTGLPFGPGAAAIALGLSQREAPGGERRGMATGGVVLGAIAVVASFVLLLIG